MTTRIVCPECKASLKMANAPPEGAKMRCPKCKNAFRYAAEMSPPVSTPPVPTPQAAAAANDRGSRWPLLIALVCLIVVVAGTGYFMRDMLGELVAHNTGDQVKPTPADSEGASSGASSESDDQSSESGESNPGTSRGRSQRRDSVPRAPKMISMPAVLNGGIQFDEFAFSSDRKSMVGVSNGTIQIWDMTTGKKTKTLDDWGSRVRFSPDGQVFATLYDLEADWTCRLFLLPEAVEIASFKWHQEFDGAETSFTHQQYNVPIAFSPNSELVALPGDNHAIIVWDLTQAKQHARLVGHTGRVDDLQFTADGKKLLSSSGEYDHQSIRLWTLDNGNGQELTITKGLHAYEVALTPDERTLVCRSHDKISIWDLTAERALQLRYTIDHFGRRIELWPDENTLAIVDSRVVLWDIAGQKPIREIDLALRMGDEIQRIELSPDKQTIGALTNEGVALYDSTTGQVRAKYPHVFEGSQYISAFQFDVTGEALLLSMDNGKMRLEPTRGGSAGAAVASDAYATIKPASEPSDVAFSADGKSLVTSLWRKPATFEDPELVNALAQAQKDFVQEQRKWGSGATMEQRLNLTIDFYDQHVLPVLQRVAERHLWGQLAAIWDIESPTSARRVIRQPPIATEELRANPELATYIPRTGANRLFAEAYLEPYQDHLNQNPVVDLALSELGADSLLWMHRAHGFQLTDYATARDVVVAERPKAWSTWRLAPDGRTLAAVVSEDSRDWRLVLVDIENSRETLSVPLNDPHFEKRQMCFSPDSVTFAAVVEQNGEHVLKLWDTSSGREPNPPLNISLSTEPDAIDFSPDGTWITYVDTNNYGAQIIDVVTGRRRATAVNDIVHLPTFSPDSQTLAGVVTDISVGEAENKIHLINLSDGQSRLTMTGFTNTVQSLAFSPDGTLLCVGGGAGGGAPGGMRFNQSSETNAASELKLFNVETGELRAVLGGHSDLVIQVVFSRDGKWLASRSWDKTVKVWDVNQILKSATSKGPVFTRPPLAKIKRPVKRQVAAESAEDSSAEPSSEDTVQYEAGQTLQNSIGMQLIVIPAGKFRQGSPASDRTGDANERPTRQVTISRPFAIGSTEVTVAQFRRFVEFTGYHTEAENTGGGTGYDVNAREFVEEYRADFNWMNPGFEQDDSHPVVNVSWNDANAFCEWLSQYEGVTYRLPTEAEWEYACRAGTSTRYWTGEKDGSLQGAENIGDRALGEAWSSADWVQKWNDGYAFTAPAGSFKYNEFYLYDMHGNVGEWTADWHSDDAYQDKTVRDPQGPSSGESRVFRGGSWYTEPQHSRAAFRPNVYHPDLRGADTGFRVVQELD